MPDELQELARVAAANVVRVIGTESWPTVRASTLDLLSRHGDPGAATWVDTFGSMIAGADGREQNGLRDAAYARFESVFGNLLATRPEAAAELALLVIPGSPGHSGPSAPAGASPLNFAKEPSSGPAGHSAPGSSGPASPQSFPPPAGFPGPAAPPPPPGPPPGPAPYAAHSGAPYSAPQQPGPYQGGPYQGGPPNQMPGAPMPGGPMHSGNGSSNKALIWGVAAVVAIGAIVGGVVLLGGSDDDDCSSASGSASKPMSGSLTVAAKGDDCAGSAGGVPGPNAGSGKGGGGKNAADLDGSWSGKYENKEPARLTGSFTVDLQRNGDRVTGELSLDVANCDLSGPVSGQVDGDMIQLRGTGSSDSITMVGTISGDSISGDYQTTCNDASGSWTADKG